MQAVSFVLIAVGQVMLNDGWCTIPRDTWQQYNDESLDLAANYLCEMGYIVRWINGEVAIIPDWDVDKIAECERMVDSESGHLIDEGCEHRDIRQRVE